MSNVFPIRGVCRLADRGVIRASGADAASFLQSQLTNDVASLAAGQARLAGFCSAKGRLQASFIVWRPADDEFLLSCPISVLAPTLKRLSMFVLRAKCKLSDASQEFALFGVAGPAATDALAATLLFHLKTSMWSLNAEQCSGATTKKDGSCWGYRGGPRLRTRRSPALKWTPVSRECRNSWALRWRFSTVLILQVHQSAGAGSRCPGSASCSFSDIVSTRPSASTSAPVRRTPALRAVSVFNIAMRRNSSDTLRLCLLIDAAVTVETSHYTFHTKSPPSKASWTASISCGGCRRNRCRLRWLPRRWLPAISS